MAEAPKISPVTDKQRKLLQMPSIVSQLPVVFDNGFKLTEFEGCCSVCGKPIPPADLRGHFTRPIPAVAVLEAMGGCRIYKLAVPFHTRFRDDGTAEWINDEGVWVRSGGERQRKKRRFRRALIALLQTIAVLIVFLPFFAAYGGHVAHIHLKGYTGSFHGRKG